jgi:hypothetical protein
MIDEATARARDADAATLATKLQIDAQAKKRRQDADDYAKRLRADADATRDEMNERMAKARAAEESAN